MKTSTIITIIEIIIISVSIFSIIYTFGIVWRVEKKLDTSYKLILGAIIFFTLSEILSVIRFKHNEEWSIFVALILKLFFVILFLLGILEMRYLVRKLDGELKKNTSK